MIELYTWGTPNGRKPAIMLEEIGLPYRVHTINIGRDEQFDPAFLKIAPNNKIPAIVDPDGPGGPLSVFESGAILVYLAEKTGKLLAASGPERYRTLEWMNWHTGGVGPMFGQLGFFAIRSQEKSATGDQALHRRVRAAARGFGPPARREPVSRRAELHHRGYHQLPLGAGGHDLSGAGARIHSERLPVGDALARDGRRARGGQTRHGRAKGLSAASGRVPSRGGEAAGRTFCGKGFDNERRPSLGRPPFTPFSAQANPLALGERRRRLGQGLRRDRVPTGDGSPSRRTALGLVGASGDCATRRGGDWRLRRSGHADQARVFIITSIE